jgi:hypothetical protein
MRLPVKYQKTRRILEFIPNSIREGEAVIVKTKKYLGLSEPCFVVYNINGKVSFKQIMESRRKN